jgi:hypothetical protein
MSKPVAVTGQNSTWKARSERHPATLLGLSRGISSRLEGLCRGSGEDIGFAVEGRDQTVEALVPEGSGEFRPARGNLANRTVEVMSEISQPSPTRRIA